MERTIRTGIRKLGFVAALALAAGCKTGSNSTTPNPSPTPTNPPVGVVNDAAGFYMSFVNTGTATYDLHVNASGFGQPCVAQPGQFIECYLDGMEADLFDQGVTLQYNVPSTQCNYVLWEPYYFYNYPVGQSPAQINVDVDSDGRIGYDYGNTGHIGTSQYDIIYTSGPSACEIAPIPGTNPVQNALYCTACPWNYSANPGEPNCCEGPYQIVSRQWDTTTNTYGSPTTSNSTWGGLWGNCLAGPALTGKVDSDGYPYSTLTYVQGTGLNETYQITAPIQTTRLDGDTLSTNLFIANFYGLGGSLPGALSAQNPITGGLRAPQTTYTLTCLDAANDPTAQIILNIRSWQDAQMFANRASNPNSYDSTTPLPDGVDIRDFANWDDLVQPYNANSNPAGRNAQYPYGNY
jgi:hypothetical protein